ncbi:MULTISPECIES: FIST N-terminal domain-containing protein [unclassified Photobacterium]|uniref:FIST signal transduction protein n=1 Tax=unclassified Photobacterium TaxID=2628852 RepID=UPI001EDEC60F|nr:MULTISPECIES: FIST N-terminal domain-containing protein [unclassified Photobacterium]MCG3863451.1 FIST C-terminal domain-containing protein [Photobacterium sp. Ph6]MCG3874980.1 FIST C-terminal domain-containing protein [Photobacterium sp. Ph5]
MDITTSYSIRSSSFEAISEAIDKLNVKIATPSLLLIYYSENYDIDILQIELKKFFPDTAVLGCTSCQGFMTNEGYFNGTGLALWAINDYHGAYGTAIISNFDTPYEMARQATLKAIHNSGRLGELPSLILLHATPGYEEQVIQGIEKELGRTVPIIGGSAADDFIAENWQIFNLEQQTNQGIGIAVFYPTCEVSLSFHSGYASTGLSAIATKVEHREVIELDNKPAADVYQQWMNIPFDINSNIISESSLNPLGRFAGEYFDLPYFKLAHPAHITQRKGIEMFAEVKQGERLYFMDGTDERLISRASRVVKATNGNKLNPIGGITIFCAGCMLKIKDRMDDVAVGVNIAMLNKPYVSPFTFGEQGQFISGENAHGNLMISAAIFHKG